MAERTVREILDALTFVVGDVGEALRYEVACGWSLAQDLEDDVAELRSAYELEQRSAGRLSRPIPSDPPVIVFEVTSEPFSPETLLAAIPSDPVPLWNLQKEYGR